MKTSAPKTRRTKACWTIFMAFQPVFYLLLGPGREPFCGLGLGFRAQGWQASEMWGVEPSTPRVVMRSGSA